MSPVREIEKKVRYKKPREAIEGALQVGDMVINDEYEIVGPAETARSLATKLIEKPSNALLLKSGEKITGIITENSIIKAIADGRIKITAGPMDLMTEDFLEVNDNAALEDLLPELDDCKPLSVIVVNTQGQFRGYFSPKDCEYATKRLNLRKQ